MSSDNSPTNLEIERGDSPTFSFELPSPATSSDSSSPATMAPADTNPATAGYPKPSLGGHYTDAQNKIKWVGGPPMTDWSGSVLNNPRTPLCIRGIDASSDMKSYAKRVEGLAIKFKRDDPDFGLSSFAAAAKDHMVHTGLDSVFYMEGTDDLTKSSGMELFTYHNRYTREMVKDFVKDKKDSGKFDQYALDALDESAQWLKNSLDDRFKTSIRHTLDKEVSGPELWMAIVSEIMADSLQRVDNTRKTFESLSLSKFKGENIVEYCDKAHHYLAQLEKDDALPRMHLLTIINVFSDCSIMDFKIAFMTRRTDVEKFLRESIGKDPSAIAAMPNRITFDQLLEEGKNKYNNLKDRWGNPKESSEKALLSEVKALKAQLNQMNNSLELSKNNKPNGEQSNGKTQGKNPKGLKCFDCGSPDHFKGNDSCPNKGKGTNAGKGGSGKDGKSNFKEWRKWSAPSEGEPTTKTTNDGTTVHYCSKCGGGKGRWNDTHQESEHQTGWLSKNGKPAANLGSCDQDLLPSIEAWRG